jgi:hypothetical protein
MVDGKPVAKILRKCHVKCRKLHLKYIFLLFFLKVFRHSKPKNSNRANMPEMSCSADIL